MQRPRPPRPTPGPPSRPGSGSERAPAVSGSVARAHAALRSPDFARLLRARLLSQFADGVFQAFLIDRLVFLSPDQQSTAAGVAKALAILVIPFSVIGPFAGVLIDRWSRRRILLLTPLIRAGCAAALIPLHGDGWSLYALTLVVVSLNRFYLSTAGAVMPGVVPQEDLLVANSLASASGTVITFTGLVGASRSQAVWAWAHSWRRRPSCGPWRAPWPRGSPPSCGPRRRRVTRPADCPRSREISGGGRVA